MLRKKTRTILALFSLNQTNIAVLKFRKMFGIRMFGNDPFNVQECSVLYIYRYRTCAEALPILRGNRYRTCVEALPFLRWSGAKRYRSCAIALPILRSLPRKP